MRPDPLTVIHEAACVAVRSAWRSGYLAAQHDAPDYADPDGCDSPEDYLMEALATCRAWEGDDEHLCHVES